MLSIAALNVGLRGSVSPALVALALSEAIDLTSFLNYAVKVGRGGRGTGRTVQVPGARKPVGDSVRTSAPVAPAWSSTARPRGGRAPATAQHYGTRITQPVLLCEPQYVCVCCNTFPQVSALVESRYNAVERLLAYAALEPEQQPAAAAVRPQLPYGRTGTWPAAGALEFRHVVMRYRPGLDPVLKGVSFKVRMLHDMPTLYVA